MTTSFIGAGNLAWHLAPALDNVDFPVREIYSRDPANAESLVRRLYHARAVESLDFSESASKVFIVAVADDAIEEIVHEIVLPEDAVLIHTSGSQPLEILAYAATSKIGVFYPLQTFSKGRKVDFTRIPAFVESHDQEVEKILVATGRALGMNVQKITSAQRQALHVAAVFASNFSNHMFTIASDIARDNDLQFQWMKPLIEETIFKAMTLGPYEAQTGPARRGDLEILDRHYALLQHDEPTAQIYRTISQNILDMYS